MTKSNETDLPGNATSKNKNKPAAKKCCFRDINYNHEGFSLAKTKSDWAICVILRTEDGAFDVLGCFIRDRKKNDGQDEGEERLLKRMRTLPPDSLQYINNPCKSDMHWKGAFRHEIHIPDDVFPDLWKYWKKDDNSK